MGTAADSMSHHVTTLATLLHTLATTPMSIMEDVKRQAGPEAVKMLTTMLTTDCDSATASLSAIPPPGGMSGSMTMLPVNSDVIMPKVAPSFSMLNNFLPGMPVQNLIGAETLTAQGIQQTSQATPGVDRKTRKRKRDTPAPKAL